MYGLRIGEIAARLLLSISTLLRWERDKRIYFLHTPGGHRYLPEPWFAVLERLTRKPPRSKRKKRLRPPRFWWRHHKPTKRDCRGKGR